MQKRVDLEGQSNASTKDEEQKSGTSASSSDCSANSALKMV